MIPWNNGVIHRSRIVMICTLCALFLPEHAAVTQPADSTAVDPMPPPSRFIQTFSPLKYSRYNRAESLFAGFSYSLIPVKYPSFTFYLDAGYGFGMKRPRYRIGFQRVFGDFEEWELNTQFGDETWSNDMDLISSVLNNAATVLIRRDFRDYYRRLGGEITLKRSLEEVHLRLITGLGFYRFRPMEKTTDWSLFGMGEDEFRENPEIIRVDRELQFQIGLEWDTRPSEYFPQNSVLMGLYWLGALQKYEYDYYYGPPAKGYSRLEFQGNFYFQPTYRQRLVIRSWVAILHNTIDERLLFDLGGLGTLRGFPFKAFTGNRLFMINADYDFGGSVLQKLPLQWIPLYEGMALIIFADAGAVKLTRSIWDVRRDSLGMKTDAGFGLSFARELIRVDFARGLNAGYRDWHVTMQFVQKF